MASAKNGPLVTPLRNFLFKIKAVFNPRFPNCGFWETDKHFLMFISRYFSQREILQRRRLIMYKPRAMLAVGNQLLSQHLKISALISPFFLPLFLDLLPCTAYSKTLKTFSRKFILGGELGLGIGKAQGWSLVAKYHPYIIWWDGWRDRQCSTSVVISYLNPILHSSFSLPHVIFFFSLIVFFLFFLFFSFFSSSFPTHQVALLMYAGKLSACPKGFNWVFFIKHYSYTSINYFTEFSEFFYPCAIHGVWSSCVVILLYSRLKNRNTKITPEPKGPLRLISLISSSHLILLFASFLWVSFLNPTLLLTCFYPSHLSLPNFLVPKKFGPAKICLTRNPLLSPPVEASDYTAYFSLRTLVYCIFLNSHLKRKIPNLKRSEFYPKCLHMGCHLLFAFLDSQEALEAASLPENHRNFSVFLFPLVLTFETANPAQNIAALNCTGSFC
ncbi:hypothetical protein VP01_2576g5 [Puccinia sorghi]|uniref:Uncharacterized protein n=1 Tax=Puccinia sorghi TaxID=27349 RepID=A0A0L6V6Q7_9BASI|nr:hypothetical protein VP01_2576g5 [Puccinia sorghi]